MIVVSLHSGLDRTTVNTHSVASINMKAPEESDPFSLLFGTDDSDQRDVLYRGRDHGR